MRFGVITYKRSSGLLLLLLYTGFLCFQISYNLAVARMTHSPCKLRISIQCSDNGAPVQAHAKHVQISKIKAKPSKRFHHAVADTEPVTVAAPVVYPALPAVSAYTSPFVASHLYRVVPLRGPPAA